METWVTVLAGIICGIAGCVPTVLPLERVLRQGPGARASVAQGLVCVLISFVMLSLAVLIAWWVSAESVFTFGCAMLAAYLLIWAVESFRAWKDANRADQAEGKEE